MKLPVGSSVPGRSPRNDGPAESDPGVLHSFTHADCFVFLVLLMPARWMMDKLFLKLSSLR